MTDHSRWRTAAALGLTTLLLSAGPAALAADGAEQAPANCPAGSLCAYSGLRYTGTVTRLTGDSKDLTRDRALAHVESLYNHGHSPVTVFEHRDFKGRSLTLAPGHGQRELSRTFGHKFQSQRWGKAVRG
ncbi:peptidase inhibitor family I36 protein [Streptomyces orinoci]|uniref:Peptidase inhibitor family I36 protein n=1 Tax=Streptomyces orinoci TaxID=67339 RepID=A0ABV3JQR8_STRON|nr:peptidase inhibitor family I36 protein [Streptomyces orinoci]